MSGGIWLTSDGAARVCNGALLVSAEPCAAVCGGGSTPGPCCVDAPGFGLYWDGRQTSSAQLIDYTSLQLNRMPLQDSGSSGVCALIDGTFRGNLNPNFNTLTSPAEGACNVGANDEWEYSTDAWVARVGSLAPPPGIFEAKAAGLDFVVVITRSYVAVPSFLWGNGIVTPYAAINTQISVEPTWLTGTSFPSWNGAAFISTRMPTDISEILTGQPSGYIGVQMEGYTTVGHDAGCPIGTYNWPQTTNSVTGGVYYNDTGTNGILNFRFNFVGVEEVNTTYPQFGATVFNSYNRVFSLFQGSLNVQSLSPCTGAPAAQFGTLESAVRRIAFVEKTVKRISGASGRVMSDTTTTAPMDPRIADAMMRQQAAMGTPCCGQ